MYKFIDEEFVRRQADERQRAIDFEVATLHNIPISD